MKYLLSALLTALIAGYSTMTAQIDVPRCPVKVGNTTILDSKTPFVGEGACNALKDADKLADALNKGVKHFQNEAEGKIRDLNKVMFEDAINKDAIRKFNKAADTWNSIMDDVKDLAEDDQCGVEASFRALNSFFTSQVKTVKSLGEVAQETGNAIKQLQPVVAELAKISQELGTIAAEAGRKSPEAKKQFDIIQKATTAIMKDLEEIAKLDGAKVISDGADLSATVGPFLFDCSSCATALAGSVGSLSAGAGATAGGTAGCPESAVAFGGSCWATVAGVPTAALSVTLGPLVSDVACKNVVGSVAKYKSYYDEIDRFVNSVFTLSNSIVNNADEVADASAALLVLAKEFGNDAQASITKIQTSMDKITDAFEATQKVANDKIKPRVKDITKTFVRDIATSIDHFRTCYGMYVDVAKQVTPQAIDAAKNLITASATLVNTNKVLDNMADQSQKAVEAASKAAKDRYDNVHDKFRTLHITLFGQPPVRDFTKIDVGKAAGAVAKLVDGKKRDQAIDDAGDLMDEIGKLVSKAATAGENAFLGRDRTDKKNSVKQNLATVQRSSEQALTVFTSVAPTKVQMASETAPDPKEAAKQAAIEKAKRKAKLAMERKALDNQVQQLREVKVVALPAVIKSKPFVKFKTK